MAKTNKRIAKKKPKPNFTVSKQWVEFWESAELTDSQKMMLFRSMWLWQNGLLDEKEERALTHDAVTAVLWQTIIKPFFVAEAAAYQERVEQAEEAARIRWEKEHGIA